MEGIIELPIEKGLSSKIYGLAYDEPKSGYELSKDIYGHYHHGVKTKINQLAKEDYLLKIPVEGQKHPKWLSSVEPLILKIESILKSKGQILTDFEKKVLRNRFENKFFRWLSRNDYHIDLQTGPCNSVDSILGGFEFGLIIAENISYVREESKKINTEEEYNKFIKQQRKTFESFKQEVPEMYSKARSQFDSKEEFLDSMIHLIFSPLPKSLLEKCKGVSSLGRKFQDVKLLINEVTKFKFIELIYDYKKVSDISND